MITARVARRAKVMFSQAFVCPSPGGGGRRHTKCNLGPGHLHLPPPPPGPGQNVSPRHLGPGQNVYPPPETWSECLPPPPKLHAGGRYASYWNAFLLYNLFIPNTQVIISLKLKYIQSWKICQKCQHWQYCTIYENLKCRIRQNSLVFS